MPIEGKDKNKPVAVRLYKEDRTGLVSVDGIMTLTEATGWTGWFKDLPKFDENGKVINYRS